MSKHVNKKRLCVFSVLSGSNCRLSMHMHTRTGGKQFVCSIRSELSTNSTWMYGSFDPWHYGCMAVWIHGTMDAWQLGFMAQWIHGNLDSWHNGCMAVWIHGTMDAWQF